MTSDLATRIATEDNLGWPGAASYLARDYAGLRQLVLDRLAATMPGFAETHVPDIGIALVELFAYVGDQLNYQVDAVGTEAYLATARRRVSVRRHVRLLGYRMHEGCTARTWVHITVPTEAELKVAGQRFVAGTETFSSLENRPVSLRPAQNAIDIRSDQAVLPIGTTDLRLAGDKDALGLVAGDWLLLEEITGPRSGHTSDRDPMHRAVVRLTEVGGRGQTGEHTRPGMTRVRWAADDALRFELAVNASRARGNLVLVEHGREIEGGALETAAEANGRFRSARLPIIATPISHRQPYPNPATIATEQSTQLRRLLDTARQLDGAKRAAVTRMMRRAGSGYPLGDSDIGWLTRTLGPVAEVLASANPAVHGPASAAVMQDPSRAVAAVRLEIDDETWTARRDLTDSLPDDPHFTCEIDDGGRAWLRFGDGDLGRALAPAARVAAAYRLGNGTLGNVGAEAINAFAAGAPIVGATVRNPLPGQGGTDAETVGAARIAAPPTASAPGDRGVVEADYARVAGEVAGVQRAAARGRWTGVGYTVTVAVDPVGGGSLPGPVRDRIQHRLEWARCLDHVVELIPARYVWLDIELRVRLRRGVGGSGARRAIRAALIGPSGILHPDAVSFGDTVYASAVTAAAATVNGVADVQLGRFCRVGELTAASEITAGPLEIPSLGAGSDVRGPGRLAIVAEEAW